MLDNSHKINIVYRLMENSMTFAIIVNSLKILIFLFLANIHHRTIKLIKMI
jgi:hypothetical protein